MESQVIISIAREFGSGGHEIGRKIAERLGIKLYDHNLLDEVAAKKGVDVKDLRQYEEMPHKMFLSRRAITKGGHHSAPEFHVAQMQFDFLKEQAEAGESFVIVGRCAEAVFMNDPRLISIFVLGDTEPKCQRVMRYLNLSREQALAKMQRHDQYRKRFHNNFCEDKWGDSRTYDLCINSSHMSIDAIVDLLISYINERTNERTKNQVQ